MFFLSFQLQFSLAIIHAIHSLYIDCNFPKWMHYTLIGYATSFIILFTNFYVKTYIKHRDRKSKRDVGKSVANGGPSFGSGMEQKNGIETHSNIEKKQK